MSGIAIVNYGMGNFHSVARALRAAAPNAEVRICDTAADIDAADRVVFPGQGAMRDCMRTLNESGLREAVERAARTKPLLGVCVGEQMLFSRSDEGNTACLDIFPGTVQRFAGPAFSKILTPAEGDAVQAQADAATRSAFDAEGAEAAGSDAAALQADLLTPNELLKIPHMGWNRVRQTRDHALWAGIPDQTHFYFVHSYYVATDDPTLVVGQTEYGFDFTCAVARDNIFAVQFHPEKSADHGLRLYRNFVDWQP